MRCKSLILRNGYYTGTRCHRDAKWAVIIWDVEDGSMISIDRLCTQHRNIMVANLKRAGYLKRTDVRLVVEEILE